MKSFSLFSSLVFLLAFLGGCSANDVAADSYFKCKIDGVTYETNGLFAYATRFTVSNTFSIYGTEDTSNKNARTMYIELPNSAGVGSYKLSSGSEKAILAVGQTSQAMFYSTVYKGNGTLEITTKTDQLVAGTFIFKALTADGKNTIQVTEGEFSVKFR